MYESNWTENDKGNIVMSEDSWLRAIASISMPHRVGTTRRNRPCRRPTVAIRHLRPWMKNCNVSSSFSL